MLRVERLSKRFGGLTAVDRVDLHVEKGEVLAVVGPNGAGKTTLFNLITGVARPDEGKVIFDGNDVTSFDAHRLAMLGISRTFQNIRLFQHLNALENVMVGVAARGRTPRGEVLVTTPRGPAERAALVEKAHALLEWVGIGQDPTRMPAELPYGDQRRVEIARALALGPRLLVLDEPTAGMVVQEASGIIELIDRLRVRGMALMLIEHNMNVVMSSADRIAVINFGKKIAEGAPREIQNSPEVIDAYLGIDE
jgi:branched-chain amino acid transport system ATP-binding protein